MLFSFNSSTLPGLRDRISMTIVIRRLCNTCDLHSRIFNLDLQLVCLIEKVLSWLKADPIPLVEKTVFGNDL